MVMVTSRIKPILRTWFFNGYISISISDIIVLFDNKKLLNILTWSHYSNNDNDDSVLSCDHYFLYLYVIVGICVKAIP